MLTQATHLTAQTNTAYHKWVIRYEPPKDGASQHHTVLTQATHLSKHKQTQHKQIQRWVIRQKMGHLSSILCSHTQHRHSHKHHIQDVGAAKANRSLQRDVQLMCPILPLMGLGLQITTPFLHCMHKTLVWNHEHTALTLMPSMIHKNIREVKSITRSGMKPEYCMVSWGGGHSSQ